MEVEGRICAGVMPAIRYRKTGGCMETYSVNTEISADSIEIVPDKMEDAIRVMQEVAEWARGAGFRVWPQEWLTRDELVSDEAKPENFFIGMLRGRIVCAFILQWSDSEYWPDEPEYAAAYIHKLCVRREFAHCGMTKSIVAAVRRLCMEKGIHYIRLDTGLDEKKVRKIYLCAGFKIVDIIDYENGNSMALYEMEV